MLNREKADAFSLSVFQINKNRDNPLGLSRFLELVT